MLGDINCIWSRTISLIPGTKRKRVLFVVRGRENETASSKYRVYQYLPSFREEGYRFAVTAPPRRKRAHFFLWVPFFLNLLIEGLRSDIIFLQKDIYSLSIWILFKRFGKKIVYDFDDAIFLDDESRFTKYVYLMSWRKRSAEVVVGKMIQMSDLVIVANKYLQTFAKRYSSNVMVLPMSINSGKYKSKHHTERKPVVLGWIGSPHTIPYLDLIADVLKNIQESFFEEIKIKFVTNGYIQLENVRYERVEWRPETEIDQINSFDIGVVPMPKDDFAMGKSSYKLLQFMVSGIPTIAPRIGFNTDIIEDGINGFLADSADEWIHKISMLVRSRDLRERMGQCGRQTIASRYDLEHCAKILLQGIRNI